MKSLVEEASSITKAIEKAWIRAGQPQSFSVKIFETPEVGFLGFTKKSAKVGIFYEEPVPERTSKSYSRSSNKRSPRKPAEHSPRHREQREDAPEREPRRTNDRRREDAPEREPRRTDDRHREDTREREPRQATERPPRDSERNRTREDRPRTESDRRPARPRRTDSRPPQREALRTEEKTVTKPEAPKVITPVSKPQEPAPKAPIVKRPPKFSGRRFSGHKKDSDKA